MTSKHSSWKQTFLISGWWVWLCWLLWLSLSPWDQGVGRGCSHLSAWQAFKTTRLVWGRIRFLVACWIEASVPHWLLVRVLPQFLGLWASLGQLSMARWLPSEGKMEARAFRKLISNDIPSLYHSLFCQKWVYSPHSREGSQGMRTGRLLTHQKTR